jgi:hypothetical protein
MARLNDVVTLLVFCFFPSIWPDGYSYFAEDVRATGPTGRAGSFR